MNTIDKYVIGGGFLVALLAGLWVHVIVGPEIAAGTYSSDTAVALIDNVIDFFLVITALTAFLIVYKAGQVLGGDLGRAFDVIGVGLLLYVPTYWLSYRWSIEGSPQWLGLTTGFWDLLFGFLTLFLFGVITYGFYLIWSLGQHPAE